MRTLKPKNHATALALTTILLSLSATVSGQVGILDSSRRIDWSTAGVTGGIPSRTTICSTLSSTATGAQINAAISSCPANQVVYLSAGTYTISGGIRFANRSNVTLRGAGPTKTILKFTSPDSCGGLSADICVVNSIALYDGHAWAQPGQSNSATWSGGYAQGSSQITLTGVGSNAPAIGSLLMLDQSNETSDTGGVLQCDAINVCSVNGGAFGRIIGGVARSQIQVVAVTGISGSTYTISPPIYANNWRASQNPGAWWSGAPITGVGVENIALDHTSSPTTAGVSFYDCNQCWFKNNQSLASTNRNHVMLSLSAHVEIRDSYFRAMSGGAEGVYGIEPAEASASLIENNIFDQVGAPIVISNGSGLVIAYNASFANVFTPNANWMVGVTSHDAGNHMNLFEGNYLNQIASDDQHGGSPLTTIFRNWITGQLPPPNTKSGGTWAIELEPTTRGWNIVGNVLGYPGYHTKYETSPATSSAGCMLSIYALAWANNSGCSSTGIPGNDPALLTTLLRWGNYDTVHGSVQWNSAEIPSTATAFLNANPVPANHTLPSSFYRSAKPAFWGTTPWPAIGPDVSGGIGPGGFAFNNPAQVCFASTGKDTRGVLTFDANNCYSASVPPSLLPPSMNSPVVQ